MLNLRKRKIGLERPPVSIPPTAEIYSHSVVWGSRILGVNQLDLSNGSAPYHTLTYKTSTEIAVIVIFGAFCIEKHILE